MTSRWYAWSARPNDEVGGGFQLTVQGWQNLVLGIMGVLVLAGAITGVVLLNRTDNVRAR
jgi:hypothetical protein